MYVGDTPKERSETVPQEDRSNYMGGRDNSIGTPIRCMHKVNTPNPKQSSVDMAEKPADENIKCVGLHTF